MLADLPVAFRAGCHWVFYVRAIAGPNGLPSVEIPTGLSLPQRAEMVKVVVATNELRKVMFPDG